MSDNVFNAIGPIGQTMRIGPAELCRTTYYPIGLTLKELGTWYWGTRMVNVSCGATVSAGISSASFTPSVSNGPNAAFGGGGSRRDLITFGIWSVLNQAVTSGLASAGSGFSLFLASGITPNTFMCAYDGSLWYPYIQVVGSMSAQDPSDLSISANVFWNSDFEQSWGPSGPPNITNATIFGKNVAIGYEIIDEPGSSGSFSPPSMTFNSDWPYT